MQTVIKPYRIFYGWWIVGSSFLISLFVGGSVFYGFTAFFEPIVDEMGWTYAQISLASSLRGLEAGLLAPFIGILVDRWGPRRLIFAGSILAAAGMFVLSRSSTLVMFYAAFALMTLGTSACTGISLMTTVANWFHRKIGLATAISICGFGFSGLLVPAIVGLIDAIGWRGALVTLAAAIAAVVLPLSMVFRQKPEHYGLLPDGARNENPGGLGSDDSPVVSQDVKAGEVTEAAADLKIGQALRSGTFWRLALMSVCHMIVMSSTILHVMPYLSSIGIARSTSGFIAAAVPMASIAGRLLFGSLGDRFDRRKVAAGAFVLMGMGILCFGLASIAGFWLVVPFLALFGTGYGGGNALRISLAREYFGRTNFGSITGLVMGIGAIGGIAAPPLAGWVFDTWGSYTVVWLLFGVLPIATLIFILTLPKVAK